MIAFRAPPLRFAASLLALAAAACSTMPSDRATAPALPAQWTDAAAQPAAVDLTDWWRDFSDPTLDVLVAEGLASNGDILRAALRVQEARAAGRRTIGNFLPDLTATARGQYTETLDGPEPTVGGVQTDQWLTSYGGQVSWEVPLFARIEASVTGARAATNVTLADLRGAQVALAADVAQAYIDLRAAQNRGAALAETAQLASQLADILELSARTGLAAEADAADARRLAESLRARLPDVAVAARQSENTLAVLRGKAPGTETPELARALSTIADAPTPRLAGAPAAPADLLRLRPDVASAEYTVLAQAAAVGVARADLLPRLTLTGTIGVGPVQIGASSTQDVTQAQVIPFVSMPLFDWGVRQAAVRERQSQFEASLVTYRDVVARAVGESSTSLSRLEQGRIRLEASRGAEAAAERNARGVRASFGAGIASLTDRLRADQQLIDARLTRIDAEAALASASVAVYRAFGGGPPLATVEDKVREARAEMRD
jgi:NodT family efflux transporter outer membrane factor (OMF) lipoprotein